MKYNYDQISQQQPLLSSITTLKLSNSENSFQFLSTLATEISNAVESVGTLLHLTNDRKLKQTSVIALIEIRENPQPNYLYPPTSPPLVRHILFTTHSRNFVTLNLIL